MLDAMASKRSTMSNLEIKQEVKEEYDKDHGVVYLQGRRDEMEDRHSVIKFESFEAYAVFDGHSDYRCAEISAKLCLPTLKSLIEHKIAGISKQDRQNLDITDLIQKALDETDNDLYNGELDEQFLKSGCTAIIAVIDSLRQVIYMANLGDSKGYILVNNNIYFATEEHKPNKPDELKRINDAGGVVLFKRVQGILAVSRALGDFHLKDKPFKGVCILPDFMKIEPLPLLTCEAKIDQISISDILNDGKYKDEKKIRLLILLVCDGVTDVIKDDKIAECVHDNFEKVQEKEDTTTIEVIVADDKLPFSSAKTERSSKKRAREVSTSDTKIEEKALIDNTLYDHSHPQLVNVAKKLVYTALDAGSQDNISAMIIKVLDKPTSVPVTLKSIKNVKTKRKTKKPKKKYCQCLNKFNLL